MRGFLMFVAAVVVLYAPAESQRVELQCKPVIRPVVHCEAHSIGSPYEKTPTYCRNS
jgi:hypothetical protein